MLPIRTRPREIATLLAALIASGSAQLLFRRNYYLAAVSATVLGMVGAWAAARTDYHRREIATAPRGSAWPRHPLLAVLAAAALAATIALQRHDQADAWQLFLWVAAIVLMNAAYAELNDLADGLRRQKLTAAVVVLLMTTALAVRIYQLEDLPGGFHGDEGELGLLALDLVAGTRVRPFATGWDEIPTLVSYVQAAGVWAAGADVAGVRMVSAVAGGLTVVAVFLFLRAAAGFWPAIIAAVFLIFSPWHIFFSRLASADFVVALLTVVVMLGLVRAATEASAAYYVLAGTAAGLCFYFANKAVVLPPTVAAAFLALLLVRPRETIRQVPLWRLSLVVAVGVFAPQLLYYLEHDWYRAFLSHPSVHWVLSPENLSDSKVFFHTDSMAGVMAHQVERSLLIFLYYPDVGPFFSYARSPLLTAIEATFFVVGLGVCLRRCREPLAAVLLAWFAVGLQISIFTDHPPQAHRMIGIIALPSIIAALAVDWLRRSLAGLPFALAAGVSIVVTILVLAGTAASGTYEFFVAHPPIQGWRGITVIARAMREYGKTDHVVPVNLAIMWKHNGTIRFIARGVQPHPIDRLDPSQPWQGPSDRDVAFLFVGRPADDLALLRRWYPHGVERPFEVVRGRPTVTIFEVPR